MYELDQRVGQARVEDQLPAREVVLGASSSAEVEKGRGSACGGVGLVMRRRVKLCG